MVTQGLFRRIFRSAMTSPLLEVIDLGKRFESRKRDVPPLNVIEGLSFSVAAGELVTLVGPSGAGKSTLLDILAHIERPTHGVVRFRGEEILSPRTEALDPGLRCQIGYVTQADNLLPWRTARENILFPLEAQGRADRAAREQVAALVDAIGLRGFEDFYPEQLSGGMRKRVALARTLAYDPPIILLDEPFGALDAPTRARLHVDLLELWSSRKKTILFVTHDITEAIALSDRVLVLSKAPARITADHPIPLGRPRSTDRIVTEPGFASLYEKIRAGLV
jgi:NitT/TauT family transport system ATP-binding protein